MCVRLGRTLEQSLPGRKWPEQTKSAARQQGTREGCFEHNKPDQAAYEPEDPARLRIVLLLGACTCSSLDDEMDLLTRKKVTSDHAFMGYKVTR